MTTKTAGSKTTADRPASGPTARELDAAYRIHTLARIVHGQLGAASPWTPTPPTVTPHGSVPGWEASPMPPWQAPWGSPYGWPR